MQGTNGRLSRYFEYSPVLESVEALEPRILFAIAFSITDIAERLPEDPAPIVFASANGVGSTFNGYVYASGQVANLRSVMNASNVTVADMNGSGAVLGLALGGSVSIENFIYKDGQVTMLDDVLGMQSITYTVSAINDNGDVAGAFASSGGLHLFRTENREIRDLVTLDTPMITDLSNNGIVVGRYMKEGKETAFLFDNSLHDIPTLTPTTSPFALAEAVSSTGFVTGYTIPGTVSGERPFLYDGTSIVDLHPGGVGGVGYGVDDAGDVVGIGAIQGPEANGGATGFFAPRGGAPVSIDSLIGTDANRWHIGGGQQFDAQGRFAAFGYDRQTLKDHILLLTPTDPHPGGGGTMTPGSLKTTVEAPAISVPSIPGDRGTVKLTLNNFGSQTLAGVVNVSLVLSLDATVDAADYSLPAQNLKVKLAAGAGKTYTSKIVVPAAVRPGSYFLLARAAAGNGLGAADVDAVAAMSAAAFSIVNSFGSLGQRRNVKFVQVDGDGSSVTYALNGPGQGTCVVDADGATDVVLTGTSTASRLTIATKGGDGTSAIDDVTADGGLGAFNAAKTNLTGQFTVGGTGPLMLKLQNAFGASVVSGGPITSLTAVTWVKPEGGSSAITAPSIGNLSTKGEFSSDLLVAGTLASIIISGDVNSVAWKAAGGLGKVAIKGNLRASAIDSGLSADDLATAAAIKSILVTGSVTSSRISAGYDPAAEALIAGGQISNIIVKGAVSGDTRFIATLLPHSVTLGGTKIDPLRDSRFEND